MSVFAGGGTADTDGRPVDREGPGRGKSSALRRRRLVGVALVVLISGIGGAAWTQLARKIGFDEPSCSSAVHAPQRGGCIASLPIQDIAVMISSTVSLSPNGDTLLVGGRPRSDTTKVILAGFNVAERRETWRTALDDIGPDVRVAVSANGDKAAVWGEASGIRVMDLPSGTRIMDVPREALYPVYFDVSFSQNGDAILAGGAAERKSFRLAAAGSESSPAPGFDLAGTCQPVGQVGQSNVGSVRSRDGKAAVLLPTALAGAPVRIGGSARSGELAGAICGTSSVSVLVGPAGWSDVSAVFASFSPRNDRLAVVYSGKPPDGEWRTLIDVWDAEKSMERLASFPIRGTVGYRIGWSDDAHRLAVIRSTNDATDARIYAIP
jgi:hypothetical protein